MIFSRGMSVLVERSGAEAAILRAPDSICRETEGLFRELAGETFTASNRRELRSLVGGAQGCSHLGDLVVEILGTLEEAARFFGEGGKNGPGKED